MLEFEHRTEIDPDELNVIVSRTYQELSGSTIPEGGEFFLDGNRAVFAVVQVFRVVAVQRIDGLRSLYGELP